MKGPRVGNDETCKIFRFATHFWIAIDQRSEEGNFNFRNVFSSRLFNIGPIRSFENDRVRVRIVLIEIKIHHAKNDDGLALSRSRITVVIVIVVVIIVSIVVISSSKNIESKEQPNVPWRMTKRLRSDTDAAVCRNIFLPFSVSQPPHLFVLDPARPLERGYLHETDRFRVPRATYTPKER